MTLRLDTVSTTGDLGGKIPQVMRDNGAGGWKKIDSSYVDGTIRFAFDAAGTFYVAEGGSAMPPSPSPTPAQPPSESEQLLNKVCELFGEEAASCRQRVMELRASGVDDLFIGRQLLADLEEKIVDGLKGSVASPARKRELMKRVLEMFDD